MPPAGCETIEEIREASRQLMRANEANPDPNTGLLVASATLLGLYAQRRYGVGQEIYVNMLTANAYANSDDFLRYEGKPSRRQVDGELYGTAPWYRLYQASEGWVFLAAPTDEEWSAFCAEAAPELADARGQDEERRWRRRWLAEVFSAGSCERVGTTPHCGRRGMRARRRRQLRRVLLQGRARTRERLQPDREPPETGRRPPLGPADHHGRRSRRLRSRSPRRSGDGRDPDRNRSRRGCGTVEVGWCGLVGAGRAGVNDREFLRRVRRYARGRRLNVEFRPDQGKGSHARVYLGPHWTTVPHGEIAPGTLRSMLRDLAIEPKEF